MPDGDDSPQPSVGRRWIDDGPHGLERMDEPGWGDAQTPFGKAVRHNIVQINRVIHDQDRRISYGEEAFSRMTAFEAMMVGVAGREHIDNGGVIGNLRAQQQANHLENQAALAELAKRQEDAARKQDETQALIAEQNEKIDDRDRSQMRLLLTVAGSGLVVAIGAVITLILALHGVTAAH